MCSCWRLPLAQCSPAGAWIVPGEVPAGSGEGTRSPPHSTTDKFPQSSEHRVKQMGSCDSIFHIIPEKPLTRPQITTLMLFSPLTTPQPSTLPSQNDHPHLPPPTPLPIPSPPEEDPLSQAILTQAIAFGEWIPFKVTKTNGGGEAPDLKPNQTLALRSPAMESVHRAIGSSFDPLSNTADGRYVSPHPHPPFHLIRGLKILQ